MALELITYKPEQGRATRLAALSVLVALAYYASFSLYRFLSWDWATADLGFTIPVLEIPVSPAFLISLGVFVVAFLLLRSAVNRPKAAELLIDTEGEIRRVTWPTWPDTLNGSLVVIVTVFAMLVILSFTDFFLSHVFENIVFRQ